MMEEDKKDHSTGNPFSAQKPEPSNNRGEPIIPSEGIDKIK
jgi:hypothetical protein